MRFFLSRDYGAGARGEQGAGGIQCKRLFRGAGTQQRVKHNLLRNVVVTRLLDRITFEMLTRITRELQTETVCQ